MKIKRHGMEFKLTAKELYEAYREQQTLFAAEDLTESLEELIEDYDMEDRIWLCKINNRNKKKLIERACCYLDEDWDDNEKRGDLYWFARRGALRKAADEILLKR